MLKLLVLATALLTAAPIPRPEPVVAPHLFGAPMAYAAAHELLLQAVGLSRYSMPPTQPIIDVVPATVWASEVCKAEPDCVSDMLGYYNPDDGNVVHVRVGTGRPVEGIAVHELVHWLQERSGWKYDSKNCQSVAAHEIEAYAVEYVRDTWANIQRPLDIPDVYGECLANQKVK